jgi:hypothetical protein
VRRIDLGAAFLQGTDFDGSRLTNVDMANAELSSARLNGTIATSCRLDSANMRKAEFKAADFVRVSLRRARMDQIVSLDLKIRHSDMRQASFQGANLQYSHFYNCDLRGAKLDNAILDRLVTKRILIEGPRIPELEALGCSTDLINTPTQSEWRNWEQFQVRSQDDDFGMIICNGQTYWVSEGRWDFFVSYATADKEAVALPLVAALRQRGHRVWYDDLEVRPADDPPTVIKRGIDSSLFAVAVISKSFFGRRWTEAEIDALHASARLSRAVRYNSRGPRHYPTCAFGPLRRFLPVRHRKGRGQADRGNPPPSPAILTRKRVCIGGAHHDLRDPSASAPHLASQGRQSLPPNC